VILRIDRPQDRTAFRKDVIEGGERLRQPLRYRAGLKLIPKQIALSGSIPASQGDTQLATGNVELGLPMLMLPSVAETPPEIANEAIFDLITKALPRSFNDRVEEPTNLIPDPWFEGYGRELRVRLRLRWIPPKGFFWSASESGGGWLQRRRRAAFSEIALASTAAGGTSQRYVAGPELPLLGPHRPAKVYTFLCTMRLP
jgi:hypothetical protein